MKRLSRGTQTALAGGVPAVLLIGAALFVPVPFASLGPGPTFNVLGSVDGAEIVQVTGTREYSEGDTGGELDMTTVSVRSGLAAGDAIAQWIAGDQIVPLEEVYPSDRSKEEVEHEQEQQMTDARTASLLAAYTYLRRPLAVEVTDVPSGSPASGVLAKGDIITTLDGAAVSTPGELAKNIKEKRPGDTVTLEVKHAAAGKITAATPVRQVPVTLEAGPDGTARANVVLGSVPADGTGVTFRIEDVGGPSGGLMFTLALIDKLTPEKLTGGKHIAGTGTIAPDGTVGPIGGVTHKLEGARDAGATLFLVPAENCAEALTDVPDGLTLAKVSTAAEGVEAVENYRDGKPVTGCGAGN